jgi:hypothetical protein
MIRYYSGFADEAGASLAAQIRATQELGWHHIEMRNVLVPGFPGGNLHDIPEDAFAAVVEELSAADIRVNCFGTAIGKDAAASITTFGQPARSRPARRKSGRHSPGS